MEEPGKSWNSWRETFKIWHYEVHDDDVDDDNDDDDDGVGEFWDSGKGVSLTTVTFYFIFIV